MLPVVLDEVATGSLEIGADERHQELNRRRARFARDQYAYMLDRSTEAHGVTAPTFESWEAEVYLSPSTRRFFSTAVGAAIDRREAAKPKDVAQIEARGATPEEIDLLKSLNAALSRKSVT